MTLGLSVAVSASQATTSQAQEQTPINTAPPDDVSSSQLSVEQAESGFVAAINDLRAQQGLSVLRVEPMLVSASRQWSVQMIALPRSESGGRVLQHDPSVQACGRAPSTCVLGSRWKSLGENVGYGPKDVLFLHQRFVDSPLHYRNLVNSEFDAIGVGVVFDGEVMYVTEKFLADPPAQPAALAARTGSPGRPVATTPPTTKARPKPKPKAKTIKK